MVVGIILMIASVFLFIMAMTVFLPKAMLKPKCRIKAPEGRGIKRVLLNGNRCIVYKASSEVGKYIDQYLIYDDNGTKILRCKTNGRVRYLDYDIVIFDCSDRAVDVVNVKEDIIKGDLTRRVELPNETSYVSIVIRQADNVNYKKPPLMNVSGKSIFFYSVLAFIFTFLETFVLKISCAYAFGGVFRESFIQSTSSLAISIALSVVTAFIGVFTVVYSIKIRGKR